MNVKCKVCGQKGFHEESKVTEFWASNYLFITTYRKGNPISYFICRKCMRNILDSLMFEQSRIADLYEPKIKQKG